jgi:hypothetical protein
MKQHVYSSYYMHRHHYMDHWKADAGRGQHCVSTATPRNSESYTWARFTECHARKWSGHKKINALTRPSLYSIIASRVLLNIKTTLMEVDNITELRHGATELRFMVASAVTDTII